MFLSSLYYDRNVTNVPTVSISYHLYFSVQHTLIIAWGSTRYTHIPLQKEKVLMSPWNKDKHLSRLAKNKDTLAKVPAQQK